MANPHLHDQLMAAGSDLLDRTLKMLGQWSHLPDEEQVNLIGQVIEGMEGDAVVNMAVHSMWRLLREERGYVEPEWHDA